MFDKFQAPIEVVYEIKKRQEFKWLSEVLLKRGHTLFEFNFETGVLSPVKLPKEGRSEVLPDKLSGRVTGEPPAMIRTRTIEYKKDCYYFGRLNTNSAIKHLTKMMPGIAFTKIPNKGGENKG